MASPAALFGPLLTWVRSSPTFTASLLQLLSLPAAAQGLLHTRQSLAKGQPQERGFASAGTLRFPHHGQVRGRAEALFEEEMPLEEMGVGSWHLGALGAGRPKALDLISQAQQLLFSLLSSTLLTYSNFLSYSVCVCVCDCVSACTFVCACVLTYCLSPTTSKMQAPHLLEISSFIFFLLYPQTLKNMPGI